MKNRPMTTKERRQHEEDIQILRELRKRDRHRKRGPDGMMLLETRK